MSEPKAISIRVKFEDGKTMTARGKQAADIWDWFMSAEAMACIHGANYKGEKFTIKQAEPKTA